MDIPALSMAMSATNTSTNVNISVMKMALDTVEENGQQLVEMIQSTSVSPKGIDLSV